MRNLFKLLCPIVFSFGVIGLSGIAHASDAKRFFPEDLGQDGKITLTPSFTPDGKTIYFAQSECSPIGKCPQRLKLSTLGSDGWSAPEFVKLPTDDRVDFPHVSPDGKTLWFSWSAPLEDFQSDEPYENFDLYTLDLTDPDARPKRLLGPNINSLRAGKVSRLRYVNNESLPSVTRKGELYFMTERLDGTGERDIYFAKSTKDGFERAAPLPAPINSTGRDDGVWVNPEGTLMLLTYPNRGGEGSSDLFVSRKKDGVWTDPKNLGPTVNTPCSEFAARLTPDGKKILFTSDRPFGQTPKGLLQVWATDFPDIE